MLIRAVCRGAPHNSTLACMTNVRTDPVLGVLQFDAGLNWYEGKRFSDGEQFAIYVSLDAFENEEDAIATARSVLPVLTDAITAAKEFACDRLLDLKNGEWLNADEAPVSAKAFVSALKLQSIGIYLDGDSEFHFKGGKLFSGHTVLVSWYRAKGFRDASIAG